MSMNQSHLYLKLYKNPRNSLDQETFGKGDLEGFILGKYSSKDDNAIEMDDAGNWIQFHLELEFVKCLANYNYLKFLNLERLLQDKAFVNYLKYPGTRLFRIP